MPHCPDPPCADKRETFSAASLAAVLSALVGPLHGRRFLLAFSGGLDSTVLLASMASLRAGHGCSLRALHVDHQIDPRSGEWAEHCARACDRLAVPLTLARINLDPGSHNLEARAREARYGVLAGELGPDEVLLTAHHQDDQAETILLQLLRGSGIAGLGGIEPLSRVAGKPCARPLLGFCRRQLEAWANAQCLAWVDDPSNADRDANARSYLRAQVIPALTQRWPRAAEAMSRAAGHLREQRELARSLGTRDLVGSALAEPLARNLGASVLDARRLAALPPARRRNALRQWIIASVQTVPGSARIEQVDALLIRRRATSTAEVSWDDVRLSRYRDRLYVYRSGSPCTLRQGPRPWALETPLDLGQQAVWLVASRVTGSGLATELVRDGVEVRQRMGGERVRLPGRAHRSSLKKLFQERGIPPWMRSRLPVIWIGGEPAAVPGLWYFAPFVVGAGRTGVQIDLVQGSSQQLFGAADRHLPASSD